MREREPNRSLILMRPEVYDGQLGRHGTSHQTDQKVWVVNGMVDKADSNFLGVLFYD